MTLGNKRCPNYECSDHDTVVNLYLSTVETVACCVLRANMPNGGHGSKLVGVIVKDLRKERAGLVEVRFKSGGGGYALIPPGHDLRVGRMVEILMDGDSRDPYWRFGRFVDE
jgi:hypothetical protein